MKIACAPVKLQRKPRDALQIRELDRRTIRGHEDARTLRGEFHRCDHEFLQILPDLPAAALVAAGKCRWVEHDGVKLFPASRQPREHLKHVIGDELVARIRIEIVQRKIRAPAIQRFLREVNAHRLRPRERRDDAERTCVRKCVQHPLRRGIPDERAVHPLVEEQPRRISRCEIQAVAHAILAHHARERQRGIAAQKQGRIAILILLRQQLSENAPRLPAVRRSPFRQSVAHRIERDVGLVRDEHVLREPLDPAVAVGKHPVRVRACGTECRKLRGSDQGPVHGCGFGGEKKNRA